MFWPSAQLLGFAVTTATFKGDGLVNKTLINIWSQDDGVLTFEWVLLITLVVIGIVGGLAAVRDAVISELGDVSVGITHFDQSFVMEGNSEFGIRTVEFNDRTPRFRQSRPEDFKSQGDAVDEGAAKQP